MLAMSALSSKMPSNVPIAPTRTKRSSQQTLSTSSGTLAPQSSVELKEPSSLVSQMRNLFESNNMAVDSGMKNSTLLRKIQNSSEIQLNSIENQPKSIEIQQITTEIEEKDITEPAIQSNSRKIQENSIQIQSALEIQQNSCKSQQISPEIQQNEIPATGNGDNLVPETNCSYKLRHLPSDLGPAPDKPFKPDVLRQLKFDEINKNKTKFVNSPVVRPRRPPPKPPNQSRGKPLPPLPPPDDFYDDNADPEMAENAHSSPAALGIPYEDDELYQDADVYIRDSESIYESMELDPLDTNKIYVNRENDEKKRLKEDDRKSKQRVKEEERKTKERNRILERFNLTGDETPLEMGILKKPIRAWTIDHLSGKEGEKVAILRLKDNPAGKWLAINEKGKIGYVDLSNIEIKPETIRSNGEIWPPIKAGVVSDKVQGLITWFATCVRPNHQ